MIVGDLKTETITNRGPETRFLIDELSSRAMCARYGKYGSDRSRYAIERRGVT